MLKIGDGRKRLNTESAEEEHGGHRDAVSHLWGLEKSEADRAWDSFGDRDLRESAGFCVDAEDNDGIGVLVFGEKKAAGGIDDEVAWLFAAGRDNRTKAQSAIARLDVEDGDGFIPAVRGIEELPTRMQCDFGGVVVAGKSRGERRDCLECSGEIVIETDEMDCCHCGLDLAQNVQVCAIRGKDSVARSCAGSQSCGGIVLAVREMA